jgi:hypothetical protein
METKADMSESDYLCQKTDEREYSRLARPRWLIKIDRLLWRIRTSGVRSTARRIAAMMIDQNGPRAVGAPTPVEQPDPAVLDLRPGEWVQVKSQSEILQTLNEAGKNKGLSFLPEMSRYCGRHLIVYKRLERIFLEESQQIRHLKHTVLLQGAICDGGDYKCDRSCMYYWREAWLRRSDPSTLSRAGDRG